MEAEVGVRVTRLRRRLSVEQIDEAKSPSAPSTPTKKRGGRLAAKPLLDNIDENTPVNSPTTKRNTRQSLAKDVEEQPATPSRRNTRIKSNTSITSDIVQGTDSPRAKRAARRSSFAGSDTEGPSTPVRQTRRTRKDSSSSLENQGEPVSKPVSNETIQEETVDVDNVDTQTGNESSKSSPGIIRKSPRLLARTSKDSIDNAAEPVELATDMSSHKTESPTAAENNIETDNSVKNTDTSIDEKFNDTNYPELKSNLPVVVIDVTSTVNDNNITRKLRKKDKLNKTTSAINIVSKEEKTKHRLRTTSLTNLNIQLTQNENFLSDTECMKKKIKKDPKSRRSLDIKLFDSLASGENANQIKDKTDSLDDTVNSNKKTRAKTTSNSDEPKVEVTSVSLSMPTKDTSILRQSKDDLIMSGKKITDSFDIGSESTLHSVIYIDNDSDPNTEGSETKNIKQRLQVDIGDQCVPIVEANITDQGNINLSCEPMDVDETLTENISFSNISKTKILLENDSIHKNIKKNNNKPNSRKSSLSDGNKVDSSSSLTQKSPLHESNNQTLDSSKQKVPLKQDETPELPKNLITGSLSKLDDSTKGRNLSLSQSITCNTSLNDSNKNSKISKSNLIQDLEKSGNENKSTFILSQIKDVSTDGNISKNVTLDSNKKIRETSISTPQTLEKTNNENKSTLILSQIKVSPTENAFKNTSILQNENQMTQNANSISMNNLDENTPLKHKNIQKLGIQTSTPNTEKTNVKESPKKIVSKPSKNSSDNESDDNDTNNETDNSDTNNESEDSDTDEDVNNFINHGAEDAGKDYQSGDSRDEDEILYEKENEIVERGVTLSSNEDVSSDSDYEKDSFIVSSNEEDQELLTGSGDDLGSSDNELAMTAKSKEKFDERKRKQQKEASREMYKARHSSTQKLSLDKSDSPEPNSRKKNRQRIDSTDNSESEEEIKNPKRKCRQRIDSTMEVSNINDEKKLKRKSRSLDKSANKDNVLVSNATDPQSEITKNQNTSKRKSKNNSLNVSVVDNEKEITTVFDKSALKEKDPLSSSLIIKSEPKTPQKDISAIDFTVREEIEEVQMEDNVSFGKSNNTVDPLEDEFRDSDASSISDNEEIMQNYDSVLDNLNKMQTNVKNKNVSLDSLHKKSKKNRQPVIDELNLTQTNKIHLNEKMSLQTKSKAQTKVSEESDSSSSSVDIKAKIKSQNQSKTSNKNRKEEDESQDSNSSSESVDTKIQSHNKSNTSIKSKKAEDQSQESDTLSNNKKITQNKKEKESEESEESSSSCDLINLEQKLQRNIKSPNKENSKSENGENQCESSDSSDSIDLKLLFTEDSDSDLNMKNDPSKEEDYIPLKKSEGKTHIPEPPEFNLNVSKKKNKEKIRKSSESNIESYSAPPVQDTNDKSMGEDMNESKSKKKRKRKSSGQELDTETSKQTSVTVNNQQGEDVLASHAEDQHKTKKRKRKSSTELFSQINEDKNASEDAPQTAGSKKKRRKICDTVADAEKDITQPQQTIDDSLNKNEIKKINKKHHNITETHIGQQQQNTRKKRKRAEDEEDIQTKIFKDNSTDRVIRRLPTSVIAQLDDKPSKETKSAEKINKRDKTVSTTAFSVEETRRNKNKPSPYLEESIHIDFDDVATKKPKSKKPKLLPFLPTVSTSAYGFTTNFKVNVIPKETKFIAQSSGVQNFKNDYLYGKRIKRLGTYEMYKKQRNLKLSKF